jgi:hypothetical protein
VRRAFSTQSADGTFALRSSSRSCATLRASNPSLILSETRRALAAGRVCPLEGPASPEWTPPRRGCMEEDLGEHEHVHEHVQPHVHQHLGVGDQGAGGAPGETPVRRGRERKRQGPSKTCHRCGGAISKTPDKEVFVCTALVGPGKLCNTRCVHSQCAGRRERERKGAD